MALTQTQLYTVVAVLAVLLGIILYNNVMASRARRKKGANEPEPSVSPFLAKFVQHEGSVVGEVVALDGERLIVKQAGVFKAVPKAQAKAEGDEVVLTGAIDWNEAVQQGTAWYAKNRAAPAEDISGPLTTSADVKNPALEALKEREGGQ